MNAARIEIDDYKTIKKTATNKFLNHEMYLHVK